LLDPQGPGQRGSAGGFQGLKEISLIGVLPHLRFRQIH
jgi:hypothetical protein